MMSQPLVTVIVLNWNDADRTIACIEALQRSDYDNFRIRLIDNGSTDGSADRLAHLLAVELTRNPVNLGYTGGNNKAMYEAITAGSDYVWLLNNDTVVPHDCLTRLVALAESAAEIGLISPIIRDSHSESQVCCGIPSLYHPQWKLVTRISDATEAFINTSGQLILYGTALLIKRSVIEKIGYFDNKLFAYCEDYDYCLRSMRSGFKNAVATDAYIIHDEKEDRDRKAYYFYFIARNYLLVSRKHFSLLRHLQYVWWRYHNAIEISRCKRSHLQTDAYLAGWWDGIWGRGGPFDPSRSIPTLIRRILFSRQHK